MPKRLTTIPTLALATIPLLTLSLLTGCGSVQEGYEDGLRTTTVTESATSESFNSSDFGEAMLEMAWDKQSSEDQELMCFGWTMDEEAMLDSFFDEIDDPNLVTRGQARAFFEGKCE